MDGMGYNLGIPLGYSPIDPNFLGRPFAPIPQNYTAWNESSRLIPDKIVRVCAPRGNTALPTISFQGLTGR